MKFNKAMLLFLCASLAVYLAGCTMLKGDQPPIPIVSVGQTELDVGRATYCWDSGCVDMVVTSDILKVTTPTVISPNSKIEVKFDYRPQPSTSITRISDMEVISRRNDKKRIDEILVDGNLEAPSEEGVYYYELLAHWLTKDGKHSLGSSYYYFIIEVR